MSASAINGLSAIEGAVRKASEATGVDFGFLMRTAKRESGFNPSAKAPSSSAAGLFQFVEQTWLSVLKKHGVTHGYARYAGLIQQGADGRYHVPGGNEARKAVMDLRLDPQAAAVMAGELTGDHAAYLRGRVGREPSGGELYAAHFLGPQGSAKLIEAYQASPSASAASLFPEAAASNHNIFYADGKARTVAQVYAKLVQTGGIETPKPVDDPGEPAFVQYASAARRDRSAREAGLIGLLLSDATGSGSGLGFGAGSNTGANAASPISSLLTAEMLKVLASSRSDKGSGGAG
ncbi:MAG: transglycosylase SLT domain-containing protein [Caulobacteraceae bacterium]